MVVRQRGAEDENEEEALFGRWCAGQKSGGGGSGGGGGVRLRRVVREAHRSLARVGALEEVRYDAGALGDSLVLATVRTDSLRGEDWFDARMLAKAGGFDADAFWRASGFITVDWEGSRAIPFRLNLYGGSKGAVRSHFHAYASRLLCWFHVMLRNPPPSSSASSAASSARHPCFDDFTLHWFLLDVPKALVPEAGGRRPREVTSRMVNTGYTWRCAPSGVVVLYRLEDAFKVFIHETIHTFGYDVAMLGRAAGAGEGRVAVNGFDIDLNEVCCELFARIYSVVEGLCASSASSSASASAVKRERQAMALLEVEACWGPTS